MKYSIEFKSDSGKTWEHIKFEEFGNFREVCYYIGLLEKKAGSGQFRGVPVKNKVDAP